MNQYFTTDEIKECYKSLEFTYEQLCICEKDSYHWKWATIGMHSALQNFMVSTLRDGTGTNILKEKIRDAHYKSIREGKFGTVKESLNFFLELYEDVKSDEMLKNNRSEKYVAETDDDYQIKNLNDFRNSFIHFIPMGIETQVLIFTDFFVVAIKVIKFLVNKSNNMIFIYQWERDLTNELITKIELILKKYYQ